MIKKGLDYTILLKIIILKDIKVKPAKRTYIPKKNGKLRPLGIPIIKDRIYQNIVKNALEPQWEYRFESISYGLDRNEVHKMQDNNLLLNFVKEQKDNGYSKEISKDVLII